MADIGWVSDGNPVVKQIDDAAMRYGVDRNLAHVVAQMESSYNPNAVSPVGAQGVMQLMPATANSLGVRHAFDSAQNIDGGVRLLSSLLRKYGGDTRLVLAAYNAGEPAVDRAGGNVPNFPETQNYVQKGLSILNPRPAQTAAAPQAASDDIGWVPDPPAAAPKPETAAPSETRRLAGIAAGSSGLGLMSDISGGFRSLMDRMVGNTPLMAPPTPQERKAGAAIGGVAHGIAAEPERMRQQLIKSGDAMLHGDPIAAAKHIAFAIPFAGAAGAQMQEYLDRGDVSGALAHGAGAIAPFAAGPVAEAGTEAAATAGTAAKGAAIGAGKAAIETVPLKRLGVEIQIPKPLATGAATSAGLGFAGVPHPVGFAIGAASPIIKGAFTGAREALAERMAANLPVPPEAGTTPEVLPNVRGLPAPATQMPAAPDPSYVRSVPGQYATPEPLPPSRQLPAGPNIQVTPLPEDTSFVRAVPAQYPEVEPGFQPPAAAAPPAPALSFDDLARSLTGGKSPSKLTAAERANVQNVYDRITKGLSPEEQPPPATPPASPAAPQAAPAAPEAPAATQEPSAAPVVPEAPQTLQPVAAVQKLTDYVIGKKIAPHMIDRLPAEYWQWIADKAGTAVPTADEIAQIKANVAAKAVPSTPVQGEQVFETQKARIEEGMTPPKETPPSPAGVVLQPLPPEIPPHYSRIQAADSTMAATRAFNKDLRISDYLLGKGITPEEFEGMPLEQQNKLIVEAPAASKKGKHLPFLPKPEGAAPRAVGRYAEEGIKDIVNTMRWRQAQTPAVAEPAAIPTEGLENTPIAGKAGFEAEKAKPARSAQSALKSPSPSMKRAPTLDEFRAAGEREPPVKSGYVRLYRGHEVGEIPAKSLESNWWTPALEHAEQVALDATDGHRQVSYVDIPKADLEQYSAFDHPEAAKMIGPGEDPYILPQAVSATRKPLYRYRPPK